MEKIENSLNQSMAEIFETASPLAKKRDKLKEQIQQGKLLLDKMKSDSNSNLINDFLEVFYEDQELKKQINRLKKLNDIQILTSLYGIITFRMDLLDKIKSEIQEITEI